MRRVGLALFAVALAGCGATAHTVTVGNRSFKASPGSTASVRIGQPVGAITTSGGGTAVITVLSVAYHPKGIGPAAQPPENGQYAVADIAIQVYSGRLFYDAAYFHYQAASGSVYSWDDGHGITAGFEPAMQDGVLSAGQSTGGLITFDVPPGQGQDIQLSGAAGAVLGEWKLD